MSNGNGRLSTGIPELDEQLGGGLIPGTMTVVMGATGIGKTQMGLQFAHAGTQQEGEPGIVFDMTTRGDSQNHLDYAERLSDWVIRSHQLEDHPDFTHVWDREKIRSDYLHLFNRSGRRVTVDDMDYDDWKEWKVELSRKLHQAIAFFYGNFVHGVRRCVIDVVEPTEKASDSFQFHVFNYVYHQILRKESDWVARDLFRAQFRHQEQAVQDNAYDFADVGCLLLYTTHEVMLDDLLQRPIESGDELSNANTIILMGKVRDGIRMRRALHVAKHRGSACGDEIVPYEIDESGLRLTPADD